MYDLHFVVPDLAAPHPRYRNNSNVYKRFPRLKTYLFYFVFINTMTHARNTPGIAVSVCKINVCKPMIQENFLVWKVEIKNRKKVHDEY